jgi:hypothetical protein
MDISAEDSDIGTIAYYSINDKINSFWPSNDE